MPSISSFYGITIYMYFLAKEHNPSHIHAYYGDQCGTIDVKTGKLLEGKLPRNAMRLVRQWVALHKQELQEMWDSQNFKKISPLDEDR